MSLAKRKDAPAIANMARTLVEHGLPWSWNERRIAHCLANPECVVIKALDGRRLAGFAIMEFLDDRAHLTMLAVQPGYQRQGVGRALLEWLHSSARTAGTFLVHLEVRAGNRSAQAFYRSLGFREAGARRGYYGGREDAVRMACNLAASVAQETATYRR
ncbi:MAG: ribosomal protein S18-alanine N-acetyltransferase [Candidatus Rariloculaceae bacterium]